MNMHCRFSPPSADPALVPSLLPLSPQIGNLLAFSDPPNKLSHLPLAGLSTALAFQEALFQTVAQRFLLADGSAQSLVQGWRAKVLERSILLGLLRAPLSLESTEAQKARLCVLALVLQMRLEVLQRLGERDVGRQKVVEGRGGCRD